jgi:hypothetical protein
MFRQLGWGAGVSSQFYPARRSELDKHPESENEGIVSGFERGLSALVVAAFFAETESERF